MGFLDNFFKKKPSAAPGATSYWKMFDGYIPVFHTWNGKLYENELVRAAVDARARHMSKLRIEIPGTAKATTRRLLLDRPNEFMSWPQFLYRMSTIRDMQNNAFAIPVTDEYGTVSSYLPILPSAAEILNVGGVPWVRFTTMDGRKGAARLCECIRMTNHQYEQDWFGDSNAALTTTMNMLSVQSQAAEEAARQSNSYRFMAKSANFMMTEDMEKVRTDFNKSVLESRDGGGLLLFPNVFTDIKQIDSKPYTLDADEQAAIRTNVFNYFGVNDKVVQNAAIGDDMDAFYSGAIEPFAMQLSDEFTRCIFTARERAAGNRVLFTTNRMEYMTAHEKKEFVDSMTDRGALTIDEIRGFYGLEPLPNGNGAFVPIRGEYHDVTQMNAMASINIAQAEAELAITENEGGVDDDGTDAEETE